MPPHFWIVEPKDLLAAAMEPTRSERCEAVVGMARTLAIGLFISIAPRLLPNALSGVPDLLEHVADYDIDDSDGRSKMKRGIAKDRAVTATDLRHAPWAQDFIRQS